MEIDFEKFKEEQFCATKNCPFYGLQRAGNIKIKSRKHHQVYCNSCKKAWVITKGTIFYCLKTPINEVLKVLSLLAEGTGVNATRRLTGITSDALREWVVKVGQHVEEVTNYLCSDLKLTQCQVDEFWSFIQKKKVSLQKKKKN